MIILAKIDANFLLHIIYISRVNIIQTSRQEEVQRAEGIFQLQDWNMECKNLQSRRQIGKFEKGNTEE
jgi:hypothetical protein